MGGGSGGGYLHNKTKRVDAEIDCGEFQPILTIEWKTICCKGG